MAKNQTQVFSDKEVRQRIQRIAWEIYEIHAKENRLILAGISHRGYVLAELIAEKLKEISKLEV
ncbi:MAG: phosphoribosyltransferase, partial [Bacteroidota bacterium]|nr:phosphoribosyltransferase [Bacteroidota bacterium]MDX5504911.1 phosphoribosyltransferase [Bacteroidota bacterium]